MSTLIENINKIVGIKSSLNDILIDNDLEGGDVFTDYPDKFRELFRTPTQLINSISDGYKPQYVDLEIVIPDPVVSEDDNIIFINDSLEGVIIYYSILSSSGNNNIGWTVLDSPTIRLYEDSIIYTYAKMGSSISNTVEYPFEYKIEARPDNPVISRDGTTVTITCSTEDARIKYSIDGVNFYDYSSPITVQRNEDVYSFSVYNTVASETVKDDAPEAPIIPEIPVMSASRNILTITCDTAGANIYYKKSTDRFWSRYTNPINITQSGFYFTKSVLNNVESGDSEPLWIDYLDIPDTPVLTCNENVVVITCTTSGVDILYRVQGESEWNTYTSPFNISSTTTYEVVSSNNGIQSDIGTYTATYEEIIIPTPPDDPTMTCNRNIVVITCPTPGATIWYKQDSAGQYIEYIGQFEISSTTTYNFYALKNNLYSNIITATATYIFIPSAPTITCRDNTVKITCATSDVDIYYSIDGGEYVLYTGPFSINENCTVTTYSQYDGVQSDITTLNCVYIPDIYAITEEEKATYPTLEFLVNTTLVFRTMSKEEIEGGTTPRNLGDVSGSIKSIEYSVNNGAWTRLTPVKTDTYHASISLNVNSGDVIRLRGNETMYSGTIDNSYGHNIHVNGPCYIYGDLMWLLRSKKTYWSGGGINGFFSLNGVNLKNHPTKEIVISTPGKNITFGHLFYNCYGLTRTPKMNMNGITDTEGTPTAGCISGYYYMFAGCHNIENVMFNIRGSYIGNLGCGGMFYNCSSLTNSPIIYTPEFKDSACEFMFSGCENLSNIQCLTTNFGPYSTMGWYDSLRMWTRNVSSTGTFIKDTDKNWPRGNSGIPNGWTVENN